MAYLGAVSDTRTWQSSSAESAGHSCRGTANTLRYDPLAAERVFAMPLGPGQWLWPGRGA
jgi:hypothetical protein